MGKDVNTLMANQIKALFENRNDKQFTFLFCQQIAAALRGAEALGRLFRSVPNIDEPLSVIRAAEQEGDQYVDQVHQLLDHVFITKKMTKEDINRLANQLDDILDDMFDAACYMSDYGIQEVDQESYRLVEIIEQMIHRLSVVINAILHLTTETLTESIAQMKALEEEGDRLRSAARKRTFQSSDPKLFIAWKDIDAKLEKVTDHCFYAADIIASIVRKY